MKNKVIKNILRIISVMLIIFMLIAVIKISDNDIVKLVASKNETPLAYTSKNVTEFKEVAVGNVIIVIDNNGNLWASGRNIDGQLGIPEISMGNWKEANLNKIKIDTKFEQVSAGSSHILAIDIEGNLWTWGNNEYGQLGNGNSETVKIPTKIMNGTKFTKIKAGNHHSMAIDSQGNLWTWGSNEYGQLGDGTTDDSRIPIQIKTGTKFKEIAGFLHSMAIDEEGNLWSWGNNTYEEIGNGNSENVKTPTKIMDGTLFSKISSSGYHSMAIDSEGNLWTWGKNTDGELGDGTKTSSSVPIKIKEGTMFSEIAGGIGSSLAIDNKGNLWSWGNNSSGQLGNGTTTSSLVPIKINIGVVVKKISTSGYSCALIDYNNNLYTWGNNDFGQLGNYYKTGSYENTNTPSKIEAGLRYTVTLNTNGGTINSGNVTEYAYMEGAKLPTDVSKVGYKFEGWYDNQNFEGSRRTSIYATDTGNKTFYAKWTSEEQYYITSNNYSINTEEEYITKVNPETNVSKLLENIQTNGSKKIVNSKNEEVTGNELVGTGYKVQVTFKGETKQYEIAVRGDIDGNGTITVTDLSMINQVLANKINLTGIKQKAADLDYIGGTTVTDLSMMNQVLAGKLKF